jgi:hypothetical protein
MSDRTPPSARPRQKPKLGWFLRFEVVLNDRRRTERTDGTGGPRRTVALAPGLVRRLLRRFVARRLRRGQEPAGEPQEQLGRPA